MTLEDRRELLPRPRAHELEPLEVDRAHREPGVHQPDDSRIHPVAELRQRVPEDRREVDAPVVDPGVGELSRPAQVDLLDLRARLGEGRRGLAGRCLDLGVDRVVAEIDVERKAQPLGRVVERPGQVERGRERHDVALVRALGAREEEPRVGDRARERPHVLDRVELGRQEVERDAAEARLQPDRARPRRRDAYRSAHVASLGERHAAGRHRRAGAAGGAARRPARDSTGSA